jgi:hypothetical protein
MTLTSAPLALLLGPLAASDVTFGVIFGIFVVALLTLIVIVVRWAVRRDRQGRAAWVARRTDGAGPSNGNTPVPPEQ